LNSAKFPIRRAIHPVSAGERPSRAKKCQSEIRIDGRRQSLQHFLPHLHRGVVTLVIIQFLVILFRHILADPVIASMT
jgi:hypothetical protein